MKNQQFSLTTPVLALTLAATLLAGCSSMSERERGTAQGAAVGGAAGAVIGAATGGNVGCGAVLGGAVGVIAGKLWSKRMEDKREALARASAGTGIDVQRTDDGRLRVNLPGDFSFDVGSGPADQAEACELSMRTDHAGRARKLRTDAVG